jgi:hypothetical protein
MCFLFASGSIRSWTVPIGRAMRVHVKRPAFIGGSMLERVLSVRWSDGQFRDRHNNWGRERDIV